MVLWFLQVAPQTATLASSKNKLALHFACGDGHVEIVQALIKEFPEGARLASAKGKLPLHFAARWGHLAIARELIQVFPAAVRGLDWEGSLPLHDCAREGQYEMARFLVEQYPWGLLTVNLRNEIPLFAAVRNGNMDLLCYMVQTYPAGARRILEKATPQDWEWSSRDIMELLLRASVGNFSNCPLLRGRVVPTIHFLQGASMINSSALGENSEGPKRKANDMRGPCLAPLSSVLEQASQSSTPIFVLPSLERSKTATSDQALEKDGDVKKRKSSTLDPSGRKRSRPNWRLVVQQQTRPFLSLHAALQSNASYEVVKHILDSFGGLDRQDDMCRWPLHVALTRCTTDEDPRLLALVRDELVTRTAAITREGQTNRLPLHIALDCNADIAILECLLEVYPQSGIEICRSQDEWETQLPISRALTCDLSVVYRMMRVDPVVVGLLIAMHEGHDNDCEACPATYI